MEKIIPCIILKDATGATVEKHQLFNQNSQWLNNIKHQIPNLLLFWLTQIVFLCNFAQFTVSFKNAFSGLFFRKQKGTRVSQEVINVVVIIALSSTKLCLSFLKF